MKLTTKSKYGTWTLLDIAEHEGQGPVSVRDIADRQGLSLKYLEKLIGKLKRAGFIKSKLGPKGGYSLDRQPGDITVAEVVQALEEDHSLANCQREVDACDRKGACLRRSIWHEAHLAMLSCLESFTLADLLSDSCNCPNRDRVSEPFDEL